MASKMVSDSVKLGRRVAATTADRARNQRVVQGVITLCADVVPEGTTTPGLTPRATCCRPFGAE